MYPEMQSEVGGRAGHERHSCGSCTSGRINLLRPLTHFRAQAGLSQPKTRWKMFGVYARINHTSSPAELWEHCQRPMKRDTGGNRDNDDTRKSEPNEQSVTKFKAKCQQ